MIGLRAIDRNNWEQCIHLKPAQEQQRFIASNLYSIAESQFLPGFVTRAVYLDDRPIGGLGIFLVRKLMDHVEYQRVEGHNCLTFSKRLVSTES